MSDLQTLQQQIAALQQQIQDMKASAKVKKARPEKVVKPYAGLNGHYFSFDCNDTNIPEDVRNGVRNQVTNLLGDTEICDKLKKSQLGRALIAEQAKGMMYFWTPNQETLMFGPVMAGIKNSKDVELFEIDLKHLSDLGHGFDAEKLGRIELDKRIKFDEFIALEKAQAELKKLTEKSAEISAKTKK